MIETRVIKSDGFALTQQLVPKIVSVPYYYPGIGWLRKKKDVGLMQWVTIKEEFLGHEECDILI